MQTIRISTFLRRVLFTDAATCIAMALLLALGSGMLGDFLRLPAQLLFYAGLSLFPFAAYLAYLGRRENVASLLVWMVIALNALWAFDSILILLAGWVEPNAFGYAFIVAQAVSVAVLAELEYLGLRLSEVQNISTVGQVS
ncbi:MAG: hypothetical protein M3367_07920 [Acidobacteriota bacterium]|nr:hypothetical protein [Acidobacteriota bacterium]